MVCIYSGTLHGFLSSVVTVPGDTVTFMDGSVRILVEQAFES